MLAHPISLQPKVSVRQLVKWSKNAYLQCFSIRRDNAIFSPISVHAGEVRDRRAASALTATTLAPVAVDPIFTIYTIFVSFEPA